MGRPTVVPILIAAVRRDGLRDANEEEPSPPPPPAPPAEEEEESGAGRFVPAILDFAVFVYVCLEYACILPLVYYAEQKDTDPV